MRHDDTTVIMGEMRPGLLSGQQKGRGWALGEGIAAQIRTVKHS